MSKINLVLDLDNTLISSLTFQEIKNIKDIDKKKLKYKNMGKYFRVYCRPHLSKFLNYVFDNFNITIWTAASKEYATFILNNIIIKKNKKHTIKMFLYDHNCNQSQEIYNKKSPKDLKYLYNFEGYSPCNTIIMDDLYEVYQANKKHTLRAKYFDAKDEDSDNDDFLLKAMKKLEQVKNDYEKKNCILHK